MAKTHIHSRSARQPWLVYSRMNLVPLCSRLYGLATWIIVFGCLFGIPVLISLIGLRGIAFVFTSLLAFTLLIFGFLLAELRHSGRRFSWKHAAWAHTKWFYLPTPQPGADPTYAVLLHEKAQQRARVDQPGFYMLRPGWYCVLRGTQEELDRFDPLSV